MIELGDLRQAEVFEGLTSEQLQRIAGIARQENYRQGEMIFQENTLGNSMYIVLDGEVEIQIDPRILGHDLPKEAKPTSVTMIRRGQNFGEVALVDQGVRSASAICHSQTVHLLTIPREAFLRMCEQDPALGYRVMFNIAADLSSRIRTTDFMLRGRLLLAPPER